MRERLYQNLKKFWHQVIRFLLKKELQFLIHSPYRVQKTKRVLHSPLIKASHHLVLILVVVKILRKASLTVNRSSVDFCDWKAPTLPIAAG